MVDNIEKKAAEFIKSHQLIKNGNKIISAVSGGADSIALLNILNKLKIEKIYDIELLCVHINHQLRGKSSDADESFVKEFTDKAGIEFVSRRVDVKAFCRKERLSVETAARQLRIETLTKIAQSRSFDTIAAGHHKDDNAETIIQRLKRGTGYKGLAGIQPERKLNRNLRIIRPLLGIKREDITEYLEAENLSWRNDHTNSDTNYDRNFVRHLLIPEISRDFKGDLSEKLFTLSEHSRIFDENTNKKTEKLWKKISTQKNNRVCLNAVQFAGQNPEVQTQLCRKAINQLRAGQQKIKQEHYHRIAELTNKETAKAIDIPCGITVFRDYSTIVFTREDKQKQSRKIFELKIPGFITAGEFQAEAEFAEPKPGKISDKNDPCIEYFDFDKLKPPLKIKNLTENDKFIPLGLRAGKKIRNFLSERKIPYTERDNIRILRDREKIIWVYPVSIAESVKITPATRRVIRISLRKKNLHRHL